MREPRFVRRRVSGATPTLKLSLSKAVTVRQVPEDLLAQFQREAIGVRTIDRD